MASARLVPLFTPPERCSPPDAVIHYSRRDTARPVPLFAPPEKIPLVWCRCSLFPKRCRSSDVAVHFPRRDAAHLMPLFTIPEEVQPGGPESPFSEQIFLSQFAASAWQICSAASAMRGPARVNQSSLTAIIGTGSWLCQKDLTACI